LIKKRNEENKEMKEEIKKRDEEIRKLKEGNMGLKEDRFKKNEEIKVSHHQLKKTKFADGDEKSYNKLFIFYFLFQFLV
jgi:hypothetical protein